MENFSIVGTWLCTGMIWILSKIIPSEVLAEGVLFLRKSKTEFVLTNLKTLALRLS